MTPGPVAVAGVAFLLLAGWCFNNRRVDLSLAALGLYLGLLDGYIKLRTGNSLVTLARDILLVAISAGALLRAITSDTRLPLPPLGGLVVAFAFVVVVEMFNPSGRPLQGALAGLRQHLEFVPLFFLGYVFLRQETRLQKLLLILVVCAAIGGIVSYVQSTLSPEQFAQWGPGYRERIFGTGVFTGAGRVAFGSSGETAVRPFGLGGDSGAGAAAAALALPALIALFMQARGALRITLIPCAVGIALAIATSGSRAALITVFVSAVSFGLIAAASRNALRVIAGLAAGAVLVFGAFEYLGSNASTTTRARTIAPSKALTTFSTERGSSVLKIGEYITEVPLGVGVGTVGPAASAFGRVSEGIQVYNAETEWNFLMIETGIVGLGLVLALNLRLMFLAMTRIRSIDKTTLRLQLAAISAPLFGLIAGGFAGPTTASVPTAPFIWLVCGVLSYWLITDFTARQRFEREGPGPARERPRRQPPEHRGAEQQLEYQRR